MITAATVLANADAIIDACSLFRALATDLMARVASKLELQPSDFADLSAPWMAREEPGQLESGWEFSFHGLECRLWHPLTGQTLEVRLEFAPEFGVLDPYFFAIFVRTSARHAQVATLFADDFHDPRHALIVLAGEGRLRRITSPIGTSGWIEISAT
jgi:uncharacterized protein DUF6896